MKQFIRSGREGHSVRQAELEQAEKEVYSEAMCERGPELLTLFAATAIFQNISASTGLALNQVPKQLPPSAR